MMNFSLKEKYFRFILYFLVIILINIVGITLFFRIDLTRDSMYSLSKASINAVRTLSEPLTIKAFFSGGLPAPHNNTERYLRDLLNEYAAKGGEKFNYHFYTVSQKEGQLAHTADTNREMAVSYGIQPVQIRILEQDELKFQNAFMGIVLIHGDLIEKIGAVTSTNDLEYQITTAIRKMNNKVSALQRLDEKVGVSMYLSSSLNNIAPLIGLNQLPELKQTVKKIIQQLNVKSLDTLELKEFDLSQRSELEALSKKYNLMTLSWQAMPDKKIEEGAGAAGLVISYKGKSASLPLIQSFQLPLIGSTYQITDPTELEENINSIVEKLIGINEDMGFLASHGSLPIMPDRMAMMQGLPSESLNNLNSLVSANYSVKTVNLKKETIPEGLNCLIIARPVEKFSDYELFRIDQALMKGTNIAFISDSFTDPVANQAKMGGMPPSPQPIDTGLGKLLTHYGLNIQKAYVLDKNCYKHQAPEKAGGGLQNIYFAPQLEKATINNEPEFMSNIKALITMQISPLKLVEENIDKDKISVTKLLSSSEESWLMKGNINLHPMFLQPPESKEELQSYDLAYILSGTFTSYFKGKAIPEKEIGEKKLKVEGKNKEDIKVPDDVQIPEQNIAANSLIETSKPARLLVLPSSMMIQDNMLDPDGRSTNSIFILNLIDHMNGEDAIAALRSKQRTINPIAPTTAFGRGLIKGLNIIGLPVLVILFGLGVLAKRRIRQKTIAKRFNV
jgi:ABC-2 type transport system permease protein